MASVFNNSTYQHMVNTNKIQNYMESDLTNQLDYKLSGTSMCISDVMKRISPEVSMHLLSARTPSLALNLKLNLDEFLPRNVNGANKSLRSKKKWQYKPVVLRNKTTFAQLSPGILSPQHYNHAEETNPLRLSKAYTLPHNKDTDGPETLPTGDSSINGSEEEQNLPTPLSYIMRNLINRIYLQTCLTDFYSSLQHMDCFLSSSGLFQFITSAYGFLYEFIINTTIWLKHTIPANTLTKLRQIILVEPIALRNKPLPHKVKLKPSQPNFMYLPWQPSEETLSRSAILSFGRYCNFEPIKIGNLKY